MFAHKKITKAYEEANSICESFFENADKNLAEYKHSVQQKDIRINGQNITLDYLPGNRGLPTIYLVQGLGVTRRFFFEGLLFFQRAGFPVLCHSRRGEELVCPVDEITIEKNVADMQAVIQYLKIKRLHIIASSFGGILSLLLAEKIPKNILSITTIGSFLQFPWSIAHDVLLDILRQIKIENVPIRDLGPLAPPIRFIRQRSEKLMDFTLQQYESLPKESYYAFLNMLKQVTYENNPPKVSLPLFLIQGEHDDVVPMTCFTTLKNNYSHAKNTIIANSAHGIFLSRPSELYSQILHFQKMIS